eukprot:19778-Rhodomonas_salina.1
MRNRTPVQIVLQLRLLVLDYGGGVPPDLAPALGCTRIALSPRPKVDPRFEPCRLREWNATVSVLDSA